MKTGTQVTFTDTEYAAEIYGAFYSVAILEVVDASRYALTVAPVVSDGVRTFPNTAEAFTVLRSEVSVIG